MIDFKTATAVDVLSLKKLVGAFPVPKVGETKWLCVIYGVCSNYSAKTDERGMKATFAGDFLGHTFEKVGKKDPAIAVMRAPLLVLPNVAAEKLMAAGIGDGRNNCQFAFRIGVKGEDSMAGVHYLAHSFTSMETFSPLDQFLERQPPEHWQAPESVDGE